MCVPGYSGDANERSLVIRFCKTLRAQYRYWEVILITNKEQALDSDNLVVIGGTMRTVLVRPGMSLYRMRQVAATEAIGDVVALVHLDELPAINVHELIERADRTGKISLLARTRGGWGINWALQLLGRAAGFRADGRLLLSASFPRNSLNTLLRQPDPEIALRFPPLDSKVPSEVQPLGIPNHGREPGAVRRRAALVFNLLVCSAPQVLKLVAILSVLVTIAGAATTAYALFVITTFSIVQPGWFTTTVVLGSTAAFLGVAVLGVVTGVHRLIDLSSRDSSDEIICERLASELLSGVDQELNVAHTDIPDSSANASPPE